ncbi:MAG: CHAT domain-containing protein, partial [Myxococcota bacterium]
ELLRDSETRFTAAGDSLHAEMARANRAWAYWRAGADAEAAKLVEEMRSSTVAVRGFRGRISGELALDRGDWRKALLAFQQVSDLTLEHSLAGDDLFHARIGIARAHLRAGAHGRSAQALDAALRTLLERGVQTLIQQDRASYFGSRSGALRTIADEALAQGALDIGFLASVALVAAPYRALGLAANRRSMAADAWREQAKRYQDARDALDDIEDQRDFVRSEALPRWRSSRDAARRTVRATFEDLYRTLARAEPDAGFLDVNKLRRTLRSDEALIVNSAATSVSLTRTNLRSGELSSLLKTVADGHVYLVSARTDDLPPLEHGTLSLVPDPALLLRPEGTRPGTTLVIADPRNDLPFARREGAMASERLSAEVTLTGSDATRSAVTQSLSGAGFVHFSGHSEFVPDDVWNSSLLLANRDKLTALDVMALRPPARLVVLSGCESGNTIALAKGVSFGLAEAFLLAGASTVVATREALDDASTVKHVERFYRRAGLVTPAAAVSGTPFVVFGRRHVAQ